MEVASHEQQIRERAYAIWEGEGRPVGRADDHWLRAEAEIVRKAAGAKGKVTATAAQPDDETMRAPKRVTSPAKKRDLASAAAVPAGPKRRPKT
jgi:hypothetical protein